MQYRQMVFLASIISSKYKYNIHNIEASILLMN